MIADMPLFWEVNKDVLNGKVDFMNWFKATEFNLQTFMDSSDNAFAGVQEKIDAFEKQVSDLITIQKNFNDETRSWKIIKFQRLKMQS